MLRSMPHASADLLSSAARALDLFHQKGAAREGDMFAAESLWLRELEFARSRQAVNKCWNSFCFALC